MRTDQKAKTLKINFMQNSYISSNEGEIKSRKEQKKITVDDVGEKIEGP